MFKRILFFYIFFSSTIKEKEINIGHYYNKIILFYRKNYKYKTKAKINLKNKKGYTIYFDYNFFNLVYINND